MDFLELVKIKPPSLEEVERRIKNIPVNKFDQIFPVKQALLNDYLKNDFYNGELRQIASDFDLVEYLFGPSFVRKMLGLPVLPNSDIDVLSNAELALDEMYKKYVIKGKRYTRRGLREPQPPVEPEEEEESWAGRRLTDQWEKMRIQVGTYGYRQIAIGIRNFLELGGISITDEERQEMREIFRRLGGIVYDVLDKRLITRLIYCEFEFKLRRADWKRIWNLDSQSVLYRRIFADAGIAMLPAEKELVRRWCVRRYSLPEDPSLLRHERRVSELIDLAERTQMFTTEQYRQFAEIKQGDWKRAVERVLGRKCDVCDAEARYICTDCSISYCQAHH